MSRTWIIWYAIALHAAWGILLLFTDDPTGATPVHSLTSIVGHPVLLGLSLILCSFFALSAILTWRVSGPSWRAALLMMPQQLVMLTTAFGGIQAVLSSSYADGVLRPWAFILADQMPAILGACAHTAALISHFGSYLLWKR